MTQTYTTPEGKTLTVLGPWLLVKPEPWAETTLGGIVLTPNGQAMNSKMNRGTVVAVGTLDNKKGGGRYPIPDIGVGDHVLFIKYIEKQHTNEYVAAEFDGLVRLGPTDILLVADDPKEFDSAVL